MIENNFLDFEKPIAEIEARLDELNYIDDSEENISQEISKLKQQNFNVTNKIYSNLTDWQIAQVSRHPMRPYSYDYLSLISDDFTELHGDRMYSDDAAIIGGLCSLDGIPIMFIGHQKGRDTKERVRRNYGMPRPEGYRKSLRLMKLAEKFNLPIVTFIDTPGAYPGLGAEERGQSEAIAKNLLEMSRLTTPIISVVIGEGGSGGALAIGVADKLMMLEYSIYSVISPEGCASILWKNADLAEKAAGSMHITSSKLKKIGLIDEIIKEPLGGAHRDIKKMSHDLRDSLIQNLSLVMKTSRDQLLSERQKKISGYGEFTQ
tara:strand:- start:1312 stop:2268 length:957 start_codon:yes stop_codon:yes gene_type:complete